MAKITKILAKIVSCGDSRKWYSGKIGEVVQIFGQDLKTGEYRAKEPSGLWNWISQEDVEFLQD